MVTFLYNGAQGALTTLKEIFMFGSLGYMFMTIVQDRAHDVVVHLQKDTLV